jgi:hypothetical protein
MSSLARTGARTSVNTKFTEHAEYVKHCKEIAKRHTKNKNFRSNSEKKILVGSKGGVSG